MTNVNFFLKRNFSASIKSKKYGFFHRRTIKWSTLHFIAVFQDRWHELKVRWSNSIPNGKSGVRSLTSGEVSKFPQKSKSIRKSILSSINSDFYPAHRYVSNVFRTHMFPIIWQKSIELSIRHSENVNFFPAGQRWMITIKPLSDKHMQIYFASVYNVNGIIMTNYFSDGWNKGFLFH